MWNEWKHNSCLVVLPIRLYLYIPFLNIFLRRGFNVLIFKNFLNQLSRKNSQRILAYCLYLQRAINKYIGISIMGQYGTVNCTDNDKNTCLKHNFANFDIQKLYYCCSLDMKENWRDTFHAGVHQFLICYGEISNTLIKYLAANLKMHSLFFSHTYVIY